MAAARRFLALALATIVTAASVRPVAATPLAPPFDLYEVGPVSGESLTAAAANPGPWLVLKQETAGDRTWLLLALPDGRAGRELPGAGRPRHVGRVRPGELVVLAGPPRPGELRLRSGRSVTIAPSGATVLVTAEPLDELARLAQHGSFHVLARSIPLAPRRPPGPPVGIRPLLECARVAEARDRRLRTPADVDALIAQVDPTKLRRYVEGLSLDGGVSPSSRWWQDIRTEGVKADSIVLWLADAVGPGNVRKHRFQWDGRTVHNIVGKHASSNPNAGAIFVTAHYDAIGTRSDPQEICAEGLRVPGSGCDCSADPSVIDANPACRWNATTDPAPGADDNATGVAAMIEVARVLADVTFDFDIYHVAFQVTELGLIGSAAFADSIATSDDQETFAVFNLDMIGYNQVRDQLDVNTNETSEWFADWIVETSDLFLPDLPVQKILTNFGRSDHASFWNVGIDAIHVVEDLDFQYPQYHTFQDLWENTFPADGRPNSERQLQLATQLAVATLGRFALHYEAPDLAIPSGELSARPAAGIQLEAGRDVVLQARVHNFGTSELVFQGATVESLTARVRFFDGDPDAGGTLLGEQTRKTFYASGGVEVFEVTWSTAQGQEGFHEIHAVVEGLDAGFPQSEIDRHNNSASVEVFLEGQYPRALEHFPYPNPVRGAFGDLNLYYVLTAAGDVVIDIYDLAENGRGFFAARLPMIGEGNQPGRNRVSGYQFRDPRGETPALEGGVYFYNMRIYDGEGAERDRQTGEFAVVRDGSLEQPAGSPTIFPNPFNAGAAPAIRVRFHVARPSGPIAHADVYDVAGRFVRTLSEAARDEHSVEFRWNGRDTAGVAVGSGHYFVRWRENPGGGTARVQILR